MPLSYIGQTGRVDAFIESLCLHMLFTNDRAGFADLVTASIKPVERYYVHICCRPSNLAIKGHLHVLRRSACTSLSLQTEEVHALHHQPRATTGEAPALEGPMPNCALNSASSLR